MLKVTVLGCGASLGVPVLNCKCAVCISRDAKNKRLRSSILITKTINNNSNINILIDCGFDVKSQLISAGTQNLDAIFLSHNHADHLSGMDELRVFSSLDKKAQIPIYMTLDSKPKVMATFDYMFSDQHLVEKIIDYYDEVQIQDITIKLFKQDHKVMNSLGFRINNFVYANDVAFFYDESIRYLENLDIFMVDCCSYKSTNVHAGLERVLLWHEKFSPKITYLTNLSHNIDYFEIQKMIPKNMHPTYDNMSINI